MNKKSLLTLLLGVCALTWLDACGPKKKAKYKDDDDDGFTPSSKKNENLDNYDAQVEKVRKIMPTVNKGSAVVTRFLNESKGTRISIIYVDETSPMYKEKLDGRVIVAKADDGNNKTIATISFLLRSFQPGHYECDGANTVIGAAIAETWEPNADGTYWSMNPGGACELELREGPGGDLEGNFRGKLVTNDKKGYLLVESGYIYVKRFEGMNSTGGGGGGAGTNPGSM
ncbi:MAG: hypothetical protein ACXWUG_04920 [Polyangiales bacterium]